MTDRRSVLDRHDLYCPAPKISGQASYGGVPKDVYRFTALTAGYSTLIALCVAILWAMIYGRFPLWVIMFPIIVTYITGTTLTVCTKRRRDILVILKEARRLEKKECST